MPGRLHVMIPSRSFPHFLSLSLSLSLLHLQPTSTSTTMAETPIPNNSNIARFPSVWQQSPRIPQWQVDQGLVKPKGPTPELDAAARETKRNKKARQYERTRQPLETTTRDPDDFSFLERKVAVESYPHIFEEVIRVPRFTKVKRRETPSTDVDLSEFRISNLNGVCTYNFIARTTSVEEEAEPSGAKPSQFPFKLPAVFELTIEQRVLSPMWTTTSSSPSQNPRNLLLSQLSIELSKASNQKTKKTLYSLLIAYHHDLHHPFPSNRLIIGDTSIDIYP